MQVPVPWPLVCSHLLQADTGSYGKCVHWKWQEIRWAGCRGQSHEHGAGVGLRQSSFEMCLLFPEASDTEATTSWTFRGLTPGPHIWLHPRPFQHIRTLTTNTQPGPKVRNIISMVFLSVFPLKSPSSSSLPNRNVTQATYLILYFLKAVLKKAKRNW